ncbi:MAG: hypothetical protein K2Z81_09085 [Cyanobacteria bacterium]|nr:hypothetical protein [Cyanobacteriota bacterium]
MIWGIVMKFILILAVSILCALQVQHATGQVDTQANTNKQKSEDKNQSKVPDVPNRYGRAYGSHMEPILAKIEASNKQREEIKTIVEDFRPRIEPLRNEYTRIREKFLKELSSNDACDDLMNTQLELGNLDSSIRQEYLMMRLRIRNKLTPVQNKRMEEYRKQQGWK